MQHLATKNSVAHLLNLVIGASIHLDKKFDLVQLPDTKALVVHLPDISVGAPTYLDIESI